jgi:2'-5' RNA ligase/ribosomal protein S18 acetylase RimI-like enzyme
MPTRRRLLVASPLERGVASEVDGLRRALGASSLGRIVPHVTLVPPLNVPEEDLEGVLEHLRRVAAAHAPFSVELGPPGTFSPRSPVVFLAVTGDGGELARLAGELGEGPLAPPHGRLARPFVPHVTIAPRADPARIGAALVALADYRVTTVVERLALFEQDRRAPRAPWAALAEARLGARAVVGRGGLETITEVSRLPGPEVAAFAAAQAVEADAGVERSDPPDGLLAEEPVAVLARREGRLAGVAEAVVAGGVLECRRFVVASDLRGQGVGSALLRRLEQEGAGHGATVVRLQVASGSAGEAFLVGRGYRVVAMLPGDGSVADVAVLERALPPALSRTRSR